MFGQDASSLVSIAIPHNSPDTVLWLSDQSSNLETQTNILCIWPSKIYIGNEAALTVAESTAVSYNSLSPLDFIRPILKFYYAIYINTTQEKEIFKVNYKWRRSKTGDRNRCSVKKRLLQCCGPKGTGICKTTTSCEMWPNDQLKCEFARSASLIVILLCRMVEDSNKIHTDLESSGGCKKFDMWQKQQSMMWFLVRATDGSYFLSFFSFFSSF